MDLAKLQRFPHRRFNPLTREWVLVSPNRGERPWLGRVERPAPPSELAYNPACYLCPDNERAGGIRNPRYSATFVFDNDYPSLVADAPAIDVEDSGLIRASTERGICRVVCFSPRHDLSVARMSGSEMGAVVDRWASETSVLAGISWIHYVQIFENRGALMGASNPHPHSQIWATATVPVLPSQETLCLAQYREERRSCLLCDYFQLENRLQERIICENESFIVLVPYWAVWPFETLVISKRHAQDLPQLSASERSDLADILQRITRRYDNLFETEFPYSMGFHQRPWDGQPHEEWHFHAHYYPPLLRSATVQKFMVGFELLGMPQRDLTPERASAQLREASEIHYLERISRGRKA